MDIKRLNEILDQKDVQKILSSFLAEGFADMSKDETLKGFRLDKIAKSKDYEKTEYYSTLKLGFFATLHGRIDDLPDYQVIWLQVDKINRRTNTALPKTCYIFYKKEN